MSSEAKAFAAGNVVVRWGLPNFAANPAAPTVAEVNATLDVTDAVAWDNFSFATSASNTNSDPGIADVGNVKSRGFAQFGGTISFFYPGAYGDTTNPLSNTFLALKKPGTYGYILMRMDGTANPVGGRTAINGDFWSIYKVVSDGWADVNTGEVNFKYTITFQPQGNLWVNAIVTTAAPTIVTPSAIGTANYVSASKGKTPLGTYFTGRQLAAVASQWSGYPGWFVWTSSAPTIASVSRGGVVTAQSPGTASITAVDPNSGVSSTPLSVTIT